ncbi:MAG: hypothetical protein IAF38_04365 [Bacteroidia bacterium]|nr:hypothetical protein [Bacteroidia bacterium]
MKTTKHFIVACLLACFFSGNMYSRTDTISVEKAFLEKLIKLEIKGKGSYQNQCISMKIKNLIAEPVIIKVEAGRRLDSKDSTEQDILVVQDLYVKLVVKQEFTTDITGFCCQASNHAPKEKAKFLVGALADKNLFDMAKYISKATLSSNQIQNAVWCVSDNHDLSSVDEEGTEAGKNLRKFIAKMKGIEVPWFNSYYQNVPGQVFSNIPKNITGKMDYYIANISPVLVNIRDTKGTVVKTFVVGNEVQRGDHTFNLDWDVKGMKRGKYYVRIYEGQRQLKELEVTVP